MERFRNNVYIVCLLAGVTLFLSVTAVKANGGGVWVQSPVYSVGNPVFRDIQEVSILSERLYIKLGHSHTDIKVKYILWNHSGKDFKDIDYAFPVDFVNGDYDQYDGPQGGWTHKPVNYVEFIADGKTLSYTTGPEILLNKRNDGNDEEYREAGWGYAGSSVYRKWFYTKFSIPGQTFMTLEVNYSVDSPSHGDGDAPYEFDEGVYNRLNYDFSPASHWGDGIIRDFYVQLDASELELAGLNTSIRAIELDSEDYVWDKDTIWVSGLQFEGNGPVYTCRMRNFDLAKSKPLCIGYYHPSSFYSLLEGYVPHNAYRMKVSSEQKNYPATNLTDMNLATAWVPANKGGIGDWVEFDIKEKDSQERVVSLLFVNGYHKNQTSYEQNNRVKKLMVTLTYAEEYTDTLFFTLPDAAYQPLNLTTLTYQSTDVYDEYYEYYQPETLVADLFLTDNPAKSIIRLTILDVYKGTKYDDTCISEIFLYRYGTYDRFLPAFYDRYRRK